MTNNSTERTFWAAMVAAVKAFTDLSYINKWLDGAQEKILIPAELPAVMFVPKRVKEKLYASPDRKNAGMIFQVIGILRATDTSTMISGSGGILKLDEDIKNALDTYLGITAPKDYEINTLDFRIPETIPGSADQTAILSTVIEVEVEDCLTFVTGAR